MIDENMRKKILDDMELDAKVMQKIKEENDYIPSSAFGLCSVYPPYAGE